MLLDYIYLHRDHPIVRPFYEWGEASGVLTETANERDFPDLLRTVERYEGPESAALAAYWFQRQPEGVLVVRDSDRGPTGFAAFVALQRTTPEDLARDPGARSAWEYLERRAPLRPGEVATMFRFWMARDSYQDVSAVQTLLFVNMVRHYLTTPGLAFTVLPCAQPDFWVPMFNYADLSRIPEADFTVGERRYGVYGHDWRAVPPLAWLQLLASREVGEQEPAAPTLSERLEVLSQPDFEAAVRNALRDYARPDALTANPLLRSRLVVERSQPGASAAERAVALRSLVKEAVDVLQATPRDAKLYRALYHTYLQPAGTQEQAAELLDLPFSTYRRHVVAGVARVAGALWQRELQGSA